MEVHAIKMSGFEQPVIRSSSLLMLLVASRGRAMKGEELEGNVGCVVRMD